MLQKDIERFEIFGVDSKWFIKDNEQLPHSLDCYQSCVRLNEFSERIAELEEQLKNAIMPKFNRQEHIYCIAFGEIREFIVVAYLDNNITLCEDTTTSRLEWCDNNFLVLTKKEAEAKLRELQGEKR